MNKKIIYLLLLVSLTKFSFSQPNLYSDSENISDSTILIATSTQYKQFEFCVEKTNDIIKVLKILTFATEKKSAYEKFPVTIKLVTKGKIVKLWNVYPKSSVIQVKGKEYLFDTTLLSALHKKFPINYIIEEKIFTSQEQQEEYYLKILKDKKFLYIVPHNFEKEWRETFNLTFKKSETFSSPLAIAKYLDPLILKILPKEKYSISYSPFVDAKRDSSNEFTMTIYSIDELFEKFNDINATKSGLTFSPTYIIRKK